MVSAAEGLLSFLECLLASVSNGRAGRLFRPKHLVTFQQASSVSFHVKKNKIKQNKKKTAQIMCVLACACVSANTLRF